MPLALASRRPRVVGRLRRRRRGLRRAALVGCLVQQRRNLVGVELLLLRLLALRLGELLLALVGLFLIFRLLLVVGLLFLVGFFLLVLRLLLLLLDLALLLELFLELLLLVGRRARLGGWFGRRLRRRRGRELSAIGSFFGSGGGSLFGGSDGGGGASAAGGGAVIGFGFSASFLEVSCGGSSFAFASSCLAVGSPCFKRVSSDGVTIVASIGMTIGTSSGVGLKLISA
ncbi:MAG: hypothetical protein WDN31_17780 [Hyphomicrobium sp.]